MLQTITTLTALSRYNDLLDFLKMHVQHLSSSLFFLAQGIPPRKYKNLSVNQNEFLKNELQKLFPKNDKVRQGTRVE